MCGQFAPTNFRLFVQLCHPTAWNQIHQPLIHQLPVPRCSPCSLLHRVRMAFSMDRRTSSGRGTGPDEGLVTGWSFRSFHDVPIPNKIIAKITAGFVRIIMVWTPSGYGSIPMKIQFLVGWTSINPSYFDVNRRGIGFWPIPIWRSSNFISNSLPSPAQTVGMLWIQTLLPISWQRATEMKHKSGIWLKPMDSFGTPFACF